MGESPTHPLLSLPDCEVIENLRDMSLEEIFKFSLISKRCKDLVESMQINGTSFTVIIGSDIFLSMKTSSKRIDLTFYREPGIYWGTGAYGRKKKLTAPQSVFVEVTNYIDGFGKTTFELENKNSTMKDWLEHLQNVFNYHNIDSIWFRENSLEFDMDDIIEVFRNISEVAIGNTGCFVFNQMVLQKFFPIEKLSIENENFQDSIIPPSVLIQNHVYLSIRGSGVDVPTIITLDDLLMINSKVINVENLHMPSKQLNKFIKLWQRGSSPHMEHIRIELQNLEEADEGIIMKGIKHEVIPADLMREFKSVGLLEPDEIFGGLDFYRLDGVKATIQFKYEFGDPTIVMYVWFDHCFLE